MSNLLNRINFLLQRLENAFPAIFGRFPPPDFALAGISPPPSKPVPRNYTLKDLIGDGFLWGVPKHRRSIERRWKRKYGFPGFVYKILVPKSNLKLCDVCYTSHKHSEVCPTCYNRVKKETEEMQEKIQSELGLNPVEEEVIVLYDGEKGEQPSEFWQGKRIVEMKKPRPNWFSRNLMQKTTQPPAKTTEIKPDELG